MKARTRLQLTVLITTSSAALFACADAVPPASTERTVSVRQATSVAAGDGGSSAAADAGSTWAGATLHGDASALRKLPYFRQSGAVTWLTRRDTNAHQTSQIVAISDRGMHSLDLTGSDPGLVSGTPWQHFFGFETFDGENFANQPFGGAGFDPADSAVSYACTGYNKLDATNAAYQNGLTYGGVYRIANGTEGTRLTNRSGIDTTRLGCPIMLARSQYDTATANATGHPVKPMWYTSAGNKRFAFDDRSTQSVSGRTLSSKVYFLSYHYGLFRGDVDAAGAVTFSNIHKDPAFFDGDGATAYVDDAYFQYAPQGGTTNDARDCYAEVGGSCNFTQASGRRVVGARDVSGKCSDPTPCLEEEQHSIGTSVVMDRNSLKADSRAVLYAGYARTDAFAYGGLFRAVELKPGGGDFVFTEIVHPTTGRSLDVRDIVVLDNYASDVDTGRATPIFFVAAGSDGVFRGDVDASGSVTLTSLNATTYTDAYSPYTGLFPRADFPNVYSKVDSDGKHTFDDAGGQFVTVDAGKVTVNGETFIALVASDYGRGVYYARLDDGTSAPSWSLLTQYGATRTGAMTNWEQTAWQADATFMGRANSAKILVDRGQLIIGGDGAPYFFDLASLTPQTVLVPGASSGTFEQRAWGFGDKVGMTSAYAPFDARRVIYAGLDIGADSFAWNADGTPADANFQAGLVEYGARCGQRYYVTAGRSTSELDTDGDTVLTGLEFDEYRNYTFNGPIDSRSASRYNSYGLLVTTASDPQTGGHVTYLSSVNGVGTAYDGNIIRYHTTSTSTAFANAKVATGESNCVAKYGPWNGAKNACIYVCERGPSELPTTQMAAFAAYPADGSRIAVMTRESATSGYTLWMSSDYGANWASIPGSNMGNTFINKMTFDPTNSNILYVAHERIHMIDVTSGTAVFTDLTQSVSDTASSQQELTDYRGATSDYTLNGITETRGRLSGVKDIKAVADGSGFTRLYIAVATFCGTGSLGNVDTGVRCTTTEGGGVYTALVDGTLPAFSKLNHNSAVPYFNATNLDVSPVNPNYIVATGFSDTVRLGGNFSSEYGIMFSKDGGVTWQLATTQSVNATDVTASPHEAGKFLVNVAGASYWELDIDHY